MLLLNAVRVSVILIALLLVDAFRRAYDLTGFGLIAVAAIILVVFLTLSDAAESWIEDYFNSEA